MPSKAKVKVTKLFSWADGYPAKVPAEKAGTVFERLESKHGYLTAQIVVDEGNKVRSPIHKAFEWNDSVAANEFRLEQARGLVRSIRIIENNSESGREAIRVYVSVRSASENGSAGRIVYVKTRRLLEDDDMYQSALTEAISMLRGARERYEFLSELSEIFKAIDQI